MRILRTVVCIDGLNLFQTRLSETPYKWLDLWALVDRVIAESQPEPMRSRIEAVRFFTSPVQSNYATDPDSEHRQKRYHSALFRGAAGPVEVIHGKHVIEQKKARLVGQADEGLQGVEVVEEKQTDVNIALSLYGAALHPEVDHVVLVSNDSDFEPALARIRADRPEVAVGLILPLSEQAPSSRLAKSLSSLSTWTRHRITNKELQAAQLPKVVSYKSGQRTKQIRRPDAWAPPAGPAD